MNRDGGIITIPGLPLKMLFSIEKAMRLRGNNIGTDCRPHLYSIWGYIPAEYRIVLKLLYIQTYCYSSYKARQTSVWTYT
jgi:hypothetical protein